MSVRLVRLALIAALFAPALLPAQLPRSTGQPVNRAPDKNAAQIMITSFQSNDFLKSKKGSGALAAEEMRRQVARAFSPEELYVTPRERLRTNWEHSPFPQEEVDLHPYDAHALAIMLRTDEYIVGSIVRTGARFRVEADLVLTRDLKARQPLGVGEDEKIGDAIKSLVRELKEARKQMDGERKCKNAAREGRYPEAIEFANAAIASYPKATLARMCLLSVLSVAKAPPREVEQVARELVRLDPRSNVGLNILADVYRQTNQRDSLTMVLARIMRNDTGDTLHAGKIREDSPQYQEKTPAEVVASARKRIVAGDTTEGVRTTIIEQADLLSNRGKLAQNDPATATQQFEEALGMLNYADSVVTRAQKARVNSLKIIVNVALAHLKFTAAVRANSCALAKEADRFALEALLGIPVGAHATTSPQAQWTNQAVRIHMEIEQFVAARPICRQG